MVCIDNSFSTPAMILSCQSFYGADSLAKMPGFDHRQGKASLNSADGNRLLDHTHVSGGK